MDPFTIALATFGIQKLRGKSTKTALKDAALLGGGAAGLAAFAPGAASSLGIGGSPFSSLGFGKGPIDPARIALDQTTAATNVTAKMSPSEIIARQAPYREPSLFQKAGKGIKGFIGQSEKRNPITGVIEQEGKGFRGLDKGTQLALGATGASLISSALSDDEEMKPPFTDEDYAKEYAKQASKTGPFERATYTQVAGTSPYDYSSSGMFRLKEGGIVSAMPKFNVGGINYLPSKVDHDEDDVNNYVRAEGYVEDGSGNGNKDEDTMLAQLADGEFVSRADAILGAGIMEGASPKNMKDMRKKGAAFFYDQQAKFKRVYDLLNASRKVN